MSALLRKRTAQLDGLLTGDGLRRMLEENIHHAVDILLPFVTSFIDRSVGLEANFDLIRMGVQCIDNITQVLGDHREVHWKEGDLLRLQSEI